MSNFLSLQKAELSYEVALRGGTSETKLSPLVYVLKDMQGKDLGSWHVKDFKLTKYSA